MGNLSKSKRKWIVTLVVAGAIAVAAIVLVIIGVATHDEPGRLNGQRRPCLAVVQRESVARFLWHSRGRGS